MAVLLATDSRHSSRMAGPCTVTLHVYPIHKCQSLWHCLSKHGMEGIQFKDAYSPSRALMTGLWQAPPGTVVLQEKYLTRRRPAPQPCLSQQARAG